MMTEYPDCCYSVPEQGYYNTLLRDDGGEGELCTLLQDDYID